MKFCPPFLLALAIVLFWSMPVSSAEKNDTVLESIVFQSDDGKGENIRFKLNEEQVPKIFTIQDANPRIVLDFPDTRCSSSVTRSIDTKGKLVRKIRVGIHSDQAPKIRVVVDLAPNGEYQHKQHFDAQEKTLVVSVFSTNEGVSQKEKRKKGAETTSPPAKAITATPGPVQPEDPALEKKGGEPPQLPQQEETVAKTPEKTVSVPPEAEPPLAVNRPPDTPSASSAPAPEQPAPEIVGAKTEGKEEKAASKGQTPDTKSTGKKQEPLLSAVTFENTSNKGEMVLFKLNGFHPPTVFGIEKGEPKVVCDFPGTRLAEQVSEVIRCNGKYVDSIRVTKQTKPNKIRVILNLIPSRNYDLQQVFFKEDNLFVLIMNSQDIPTEKTATH